MSSLSLNRTRKAEPGPGKGEPPAELVGGEEWGSSEGVGQISVRNLRKVFHRTGGSEVAAVDNVSLDVAAGEIVVLLGPSGCGKTTLLRCIAGLESPTSGEVALSGRTVFSDAARVRIPPENRHLTMMFQSYAVWPHMTVRQNVTYPLQSRRVPKAQHEAKVRATLEKVGIPDLIDQYPGQLSGGQQQRVALARCLVVDPTVVLFDEPLSNVDAKVREQLRVELVAMQRQLKFSALYVTHDQDEAMQIADHLAVMRSGKIVQLGPPQEVYKNPVSRYVANFVGSMNEWPATVTAVDDSDVTASSPLGAVVARRGRAASGLGPGDEVALLIRPEEVGVSPGHDGAMAANELTGTVAATMFLGSHTEYLIDVGGEKVMVWAADRDGWPEGTAVRVTLPKSALLVLPTEAVPQAEVTS